MSRKRNIINACPEHIDPRKLPARCYFDKSGNGHWYTTFKVDGKPRRKKIAGPKATMADLYKAMELHVGGDIDNLIWLGKKFRESVQYKQISKASQKDWDYCAKVIENHPSKQPGLTMGKGALSAWSPPVSQKLIDQIAEVNGPSAAAHCARYLKRLSGWGVNRGYLQKEIIGKVEMPKERKQRRLPESELTGKLISFAQERGSLQPHVKGSCSPFIWKALVISHQCRLRGVEVFSLTDDKVLDEGLHCVRAKGSNENITRWSPDLQNAIKSAQDARNAIWSKRRMPVPMKPEDRLIMVNESGLKIKSSAWQKAWRRFMDQAIEAGLITKEQHFGLHDLKRRGVTDTKGTKQDKMQASGHKSIAMLDVYDRSIAVVDAAGE